VLGDAMKSLAFRAHSKHLELGCHIAVDVPAALVGDPSRLRQTIVNLVGNAIKFTERGEVNLDVRCESRTAGDCLLRFAVQDTGIGISPEKLETIFGAFEQADSSMSRRFGGTGLGLAISKRLVELMGGRISVESKLHRGSTFRFTARFGISAEPIATLCVDIPQRLAGVRVLVVDDHASNRFSLEEMLRNWQMEPTIACNVQQAMAQLLMAQKAGMPYSVLLIDAHMPDEDGFELLRQIRDKPALSAAVVMMLASGDLLADISRCEQLGVANYLVKPIKQSELFDLLMRLLAATWVEEPAPAETAAVTTATGPRLRVLLAEDSPVNQTLALGVLKRFGHEVTLAENGRQALEALERSSFDVVLMDVQMPEMDGLEATAAIRAREKQTGRHTPIVAMTAHAMKGDRECCLAAGMDGYVAKPVRSHELATALEQALTKSPAATVEPPDASILDWDRTLRRASGDLEQLRELAAALAPECRQMLDLVEASLTSRDGAALRRAAHTIGGCARIFISPAVEESALRLEFLAKDGEFEPAMHAAAELKQLVECLLAAVSSRLST
jgi:CheY-like chemotaxis protein/HPt (histidine-containing phosphotransfer) domain-containing protein